MQQWLSQKWLSLQDLFLKKKPESSDFYPNPATYQKQNTKDGYLWGSWKVIMGNSLLFLESLLTPCI